MFSAKYAATALGIVFIFLFMAYNAYCPVVSWGRDGLYGRSEFGRAFSLWR